MLRSLFNRLWRPEVAFALLLWFGVQIAFRTRAFDDPGALWHTRVGEQILTDGFMWIDPFTYTHPNSTWIPQQWGGEVSMALAYRLGRFDAMLALFSAGVSLLYTWIFSRAVRNGMHPLLAGVVIGGAAIVSAFHFYARPHMITIAGMAVVMAWLIDFERGRATAWRLWWLIPVGVVWTNIHGGWLGGVATLGLAVLGWGAVWLWNSRQKSPPPAVPTSRDDDLPLRGGGVEGGLFSHLPPGGGGRFAPRIGWGGLDHVTPIHSWRSAWLLAGIVVACLLTPFINPFGMEMLNTWKKIVGSPAMKEFVTEHQPLSLGHTAGQVVVGLFAFYCFLLAGTLRKVPRVTRLLPFVWFLLSVQSIRQGPLFAVITAVAMADIWPETRWYRLLKKYGDSLSRESEESPRGWGWLAVPAGVLMLVLAMQHREMPAPVVGSGWAGLSPFTQPVELEGPLKEYARNVPRGTSIFNDCNLGGFVIHHAPELKIFMDDRFELYGDAWLRNYVDIVRNRPEEIEAWADQYGFDHAIVCVEPERIPLELYLSESPRWIEVARCSTGAIFRRKPASEVAKAK